MVVVYVKQVASELFMLKNWEFSNCTDPNYIAFSPTDRDTAEAIKWNHSCALRCLICSVPLSTFQNDCFVFRIYSVCMSWALFGGY